MAVLLKQYIELKGDNPLDAQLIEKPLKAYMVALLALEDGADASAEHYGIGLASVYASMSFYEENRENIEDELQQLDDQIRDVGQDGWQAIAQFKKRLDNPPDN